jgi:hypothetical protein
LLEGVLKMNEHRDIIEAILAAKDVVRYQVKYADYSEGMWTAPSQLTESRFDKISDDLSVTKVKIYWEHGDLVLSA